MVLCLTRTKNVLTTNSSLSASSDLPSSLGLKGARHERGSDGWGYYITEGETRACANPPMVQPQSKPKPGIGFPRCDMGFVAAESIQMKLIVKSVTDASTKTGPMFILFRVNSMDKDFRGKNFT